MELITPEIILSAYKNGYFPMAESRDTKRLAWFYPEQRGIIPLDNFHIPRSLKKFLKTHLFEIRVSTVFPDVIRACALARDDSWINEQIIALYTQLWQSGRAHSVECFRDNKLVGGLYGVSIGAAFFGESMFSAEPQASKVALVYLVERLNATGYSLLDAQYMNEHLKQFGAIEIPRDDYLRRLKTALSDASNPSSRFLTASVLSA